MSRRPNPKRHVRATLGFALGALVLVTAGEASAGIVAVSDDGSRLIYIHDPQVEARRAHDVTLARDGSDYRISDRAADVQLPPDTPCTRAGDREVLCPVGGVTRFEVTLGESTDRLEVTASLPVIACGGPGNDVLSGGPMNDILGGGEGRDEVRGEGGDDAIRVDLGFLGVTACDSGDQPFTFERLDGGPGADFIEGGPGSDVILGGEDDDILRAYAGSDRLEGGDGSDTMLGMEGTDTVSAGGGSDFLFGGEDNDELDGGSGNDSLGLTIRHDADGLADGTAVVTSVETGDDRLDGGDGDDTLVAGPGNIIYDPTDPLANLRLGFVDRSLQSAALNGADHMKGGEGVDEVSYLNRGLPVSVSMDGLANDGSTGELDRVSPDVERVIGGAGDDLLRAGPAGSGLLFGDLGADTLQGDAGPDVLSGGFDDAPDVLEGAGGSDDLRGGPGDDALSGGPGFDVLRGGGEDDQLAGQDGIDALIGGTGSDLLDGGSGGDCLYGYVVEPGVPSPCRADLESEAVGADGADLLRGGAGRDLLQGGQEEDVADYSGSRARHVIVLQGGRAPLGADAGSLTVQDDIGGDVESARGGRSHDVLVGNGRDNLLDGGAGDDQVVGAGGMDRLRGGSGVDLLDGRDGEGDVIRCGTKRDLALVDGFDETVEALSDVCEGVDGGGARLPGRPPELGPNRRCSVPIRLKGAGRPFYVTRATRLPWTTVVDASSCPARLRGSVLRSGRFTLRSTPRRRRVEIELTGGGRRNCRGSLVRTRRLDLETAGRPPIFVRGRSVGAQARKASWSLIDSCAGTLVRVRTGRVRLSGGRLGRTVVVGPGSQRLVRHISVRTP